MTKVLEKRTSSSAQAPSGIAHEADLYGWVQQQVAHLRAGRADWLDIENIAEELSDLGKAEFRDLHSAIAIVVQHMLKWDMQPERRSRSWLLSIIEHRDRIGYTLADSPSLKSRLNEATERGYRSARNAAASELDRPLSDFPVVCPYGWQDIVGRRFEMDGEHF